MSWRVNSRFISLWKTRTASVSESMFSGSVSTFTMGMSAARMTVAATMSPVTSLG